tara:strand:- start:4522 stop:4824 length:303 start_codon:yes stop_codon:yes gene_type:complete
MYIIDMIKNESNNGRDKMTEKETAKNVMQDLADREAARDGAQAQYPVGTVLVGSPVGDVTVLAHDGRMLKVDFPGVDSTTEHMAVADIDDYVKNGMLKIK